MATRTASRSLLQAYNSARARAVEQTKWPRRLDSEAFLGAAGVRSVAAPTGVKYRSERGLVIDVRSPGEYRKGHVPSAVNIPLFEDDERARVGTVYAHDGREAALASGLEIVDSKWEDIINAALANRGITAEHSPRVFIYCWRGGMRSSSVAWLLQESGTFDAVTTLEGGYKAFRAWARGVFAAHPRPLMCCIGGKTGVGKTDVLLALRSFGYQVLDLEGEAEHQGSVFGRVPFAESAAEAVKSNGANGQPSTEHYGNKLAVQWWCLDATKPFFLEDEARSVGSCHVPTPIFDQKKACFCVNLRASDEERLERLVRDYGEAKSATLLSCAERVRRRFGPQQWALFQERLCAKPPDIRGAARVAMQYYDKLYTKQMDARRAQQHIVKDIASCTTVGDTAKAIVASLPDCRGLG